MKTFWTIALIAVLTLIGLMVLGTEANSAEIRLGFDIVIGVVPRAPAGGYGYVQPYGAPMAQPCQTCPNPGYNNPGYYGGQQGGYYQPTPTYATPYYGGAPGVAGGARISVNVGGQPGYPGYYPNNRYAGYNGGHIPPGYYPGKVVNKWGDHYR